MAIVCMMATKAWRYNPKGEKKNENRNSPTLCVIHGEGEDHNHYAGYWANGDPSKVYFPKVLTHRLTPKEITQYDGKNIMLGRNENFKLDLVQMEKEFTEYEKERNFGFFMDQIKKNIVRPYEFMLLSYPFLIKNNKVNASIFALAYSKTGPKESFSNYALGIFWDGIEYQPVILHHAGQLKKNSAWENRIDLISQDWVSEWMKNNFLQCIHYSILASHQLH